MPKYRFTIPLFFVVATCSLPALAGLKRTGGSPRVSVEQRMIENIRDAVEGLRDTLADQPAAIQDKLQPVLGEVNAMAEQYITSIKAYAEARDAYYVSFAHNNGEGNDDIKEEREEMDRMRNRMGVDRSSYYGATTEYLRTLHKARRDARRKPKSQP